jgi:hypothetical protein
VSVAENEMPMTLLAPRLRRMDLWLFTRKAFAATLVETSFTTAGEELAAAVERSERR